MNPMIPKIRNEQGQAMVELCLMLPLVVIFMVFLIFVYSLVSEIIRVQQDVRYELRVKIDKEASDPFHDVEEKGDVFVEIPGRLKEWMGRSYVATEITMSSYAGCYQGLGWNEYRNRRRLREIE